MDRKRSWPAGDLLVGERKRGGTSTELTGVPNLETNDGVRIGINDALGEEACADSGSNLSWVEGAFAVAHDQGRLADALCAEDDNLGLERGHFYIEFLQGKYGFEVAIS